jgi:hypothetical protein
MPDTRASSAERDASLDELKTKTQEFVGAEKKRLENENKFLRAVRSGWGLSEAANQNLNDAVLKAVEEINDFLTG